MEARQWEDGKIYLYGSLDISGSDEYCSREYCVFESSDMKRWTAYPKSFSSSFSHSANGRTAALYAPDCEKIDGKYCLFYCQENGQEGVAFSEHPYGPFEQARAIIPADGDGIDPAIFVDDDGSLYYFWGQFHAKGGKLDLASGKIIPETLTLNILTEEEHGFHEGISIRKRNGIYYLVYSDISRGRPTCLGYATSDKPLGPYKKGGIIIDNAGCDPQSWNDHGSIAKINGEWYVFYHRSTHNSYFSRHVCVEPIHFNEDGSIDEVEMTTQGVDGPLDAFQSLEAYRACLLQGSCYIDDYADAAHFYAYITNLHTNDRLVYKYLHFEKEPSRIILEAACQEDGVSVKVCLDGKEEEVLAEVTLGKTCGKYDFVPFPATISKSGFLGTHSLSLIVCSPKGVLTNLKTIRFE